MNDNQLRTRKKVQAASWRTTGALGLAALGTRVGHGVPTKLAARGGKLARLAGATSEKMKDASNGLSIAAGGIGGASSFNSAAISSAEAKKKVRKSMDNPFGVEISKIGEWKTIEQRERTQVKQRKAGRKINEAAGASGALVGYGIGAHNDGKAYKYAAKRIKTVVRNHPEYSVGQKAEASGKAIKTGLKMLSPYGKVGTAGIAATVGASAAVGAAHRYQQKKINERRKANFRKNAASAFGVIHE